LSGSQNFDTAIDAAGKQYNVDPRLLKTIYTMESSQGTNNQPSLPNDPDSPIGPFQMRPSTAQSMIKGTDPTDPNQAVLAAAKYVRQGLNLTGSEAGALGYYYSGSADPKSWGPNTQAYMQKGDSTYKDTNLNLQPQTPSYTPSQDSMNQAATLMGGASPSGPGASSMSQASDLMGTNSSSMAQAAQLMEQGSAPKVAQAAPPAASPAPVTPPAPAAQPQLQPGQSLTATPQATIQQMNQMPVVTPHMAPDGSGAMTNLSDQDYYSMTGTSPKVAPPDAVNALAPSYRSPMQQVQAAQTASGMQPPTLLPQPVENQIAGFGQGLENSAYLNNPQQQANFNALHPNTGIAQTAGQIVGTTGLVAGVSALGGGALGLLGVNVASDGLPAVGAISKYAQPAAKFIFGNSTGLGAIPSTVVNAELVNGALNATQSLAKTGQLPSWGQLTNNWMQSGIIGGALRGTSSTAQMALTKTRADFMGLLTDPNTTIPNAQGIITKLSNDQTAITNNAIQAITNPTLRNKVSAFFTPSNLIEKAGTAAVTYGVHTIAAMHGIPPNPVNDLVAGYLINKLGNVFVSAAPKDQAAIIKAAEAQVWNPRVPLFRPSVISNFAGSATGGHVKSPFQPSQLQDPTNAPGLTNGLSSPSASSSALGPG
jgi:hypothetical protein